LKKNDDIKYLKNLTLKLTGDTFSETASVREYIDNIVNYFTNIIYSLPNNVYWLDKNCVLRGGNNNLAHQLNLQTGADLVGLTYEQIAKAAKLPTQEFEAFRTTELEVMKTGIPSINKEEPPIKTEGKTFYYLSNKTPLKNQKGKIIGVAGISIDITKLKETELNLNIALEKAKEANQAKTEFLENMRHDIRTPLAGIIGCAQLLPSETDPKKIADYTNDLVESSNALLDFLNNILEGIQVATGEIPLVKKKFDLHKQIEEIINLNKSLAAEKKLALTLNYDETIPAYLIGDPVRVQRIVLELLSNALTFTKEGQVTVSIKLKKKESREVIVEVSVSDTGIGIPKDKQEEIFVRFKRLTPSYKGIYKGLGLGLTTVKQFIDDLDGEIYVKSELEQGATFTCFIPFQESLVMDETGIEEIPLLANFKSFKKQAEATQHDVSDSAGINRILVVEDNILAARAAAGVMSDFNCTIDVAPDGKTAMELLQKHVYQLILMDIGLPDTDGIALTRRIRLEQWQKNHATVPIIGLTAHIGEKKQECLDAGMNAVIHKPLKKETAQELLATFVQNEPSEIKSSTFPVIKGAVVDFDEIKKTLRDDKVIEECRKLMITGLSEDLVKLADWYQSEAWKSIQSIAHKWQGGAVYYGAKRLEQACKNFNDAWKVGKKDQFKTLYEQLIQEMEAVKEVCINQQ
jgi:two-component system, OmpR family, aerobic respiration control sensor histidine kinase ArcB